VSPTEIPAEVLQHWQCLSDTSSRRITAGLINDTYQLTSRDHTKYVLQRLHPVFKAEVNRDIRAITDHLKWQGMRTPSVMPCDDGALWCEHDGRVWRLLSHVSGHTVHAVADANMAYQAGHIAARFHAALGDFEYEYRSGRFNVHDTAAHLERLTDALQDQHDHRHYPSVARLALRILATTDRFDDIDKLPMRHCHGDLKISNIVFDEDNSAICLIDLDTVGQMVWPLEMGDALRSWCNPRTEDKLRADLDLQILDVAMIGYAAAMPAWLTVTEKENLIAGLARICLELSARFLTDALRESYFGWDNKTYATRGDHNLARGKAMYSLYDDVMKKRAAAEKIVKKHLL